MTVPASWAWATFSEVARVDSNLVPPAEFPDAIHVAPDNIESGTGRLLPCRTVREDGVTSPKHKFGAGAILYSKIRPNLNKVVRVQFEGLCSADMYPISTVLEPGFLQLWMLTEHFVGQATQHHGRSVLPKINQDALATLRIPVAPVAEQRRIVDAIESSFTHLDAAVMSLNRVRTRLMQYRASVLKEACDGSLVDVLEPTSNARLDEVAEIKGGLAKGKKRKGQATRQVPYLRVANVQRGALDLTEVKTIEANADEIAALTLREGDVLLNEGGDRDKLGRGWVWEGQIADCIHQNHVFRARPNRKRVLPRFLSHYCNTVGQAYFMQEGKHTTNMASISRTKLAALPILLPSVRDQERILAEVERRLSVSDALLGEVDTSLARCARLRQGVLRKAFAGGLVPQDPLDEPAATLLQRMAPVVVGRVNRRRTA